MINKEQVFIAKQKNSSLITQCSLPKLIADSILEFEEYLKELSESNSYVDTLKVDFKGDSTRYHNKLNTKVKNSI